MSGGKGDDAQEKSAEPTPERLRKAREDGDVAKSQDVTTAAAYLGLLLALSIGAAASARGLGDALYGFLAMPDMFSDRVQGGGGSVHIKTSINTAILALSPIFLVPAACALIALFAQQAIVVAPKKLEMKLSRISIISNAKQKFGLTGLVEFGKSFFKLICISVAMFFLVYFAADKYIAMPMAPGKALPELLWNQGMILLIAATVIVSVIACFDYFWNLFDHSRKLRMSFQELKEETKESEGDPYMKGARQRRAREIATNQMMLDVPDADVIIVNPTHYAVALKWSRTAGAAPVCVAKGVDEIALRIREVATENDVPIHSDPPTARMIHAGVDVGKEIDPDHYRAVAVAFRFAEEMRSKMKQRVRL